MSKVFYHGIKPYYDVNESISIMLKIIESGGIKCRRLQGVTSNRGFNGDDYISICERKRNCEYRKYPNNAFFQYIHYGFCFILNGDIPVIPVRYINSDAFDFYNEIVKYMSSYPDVRFSDMFDEWQVKDEIPLSCIVGIGLSTCKMLEYVKFANEKEMFKNNLNKLYIIAKDLNWDIVDTDMLYMENDYTEYSDIEKEKKKTL